MLSFIVGESELADRIRAFPWTETSLGDPAGWPMSLRTLVSVMLGANQPMFLVWGSERTLLYNDQYVSVLQGHHPDALGRDFLAVWSEIEADLRPLVEDAYAGRPSHMDDILLMMERNGYPEETHFSYSYTPVPRQGGGVDGFFCACVETTEQVMATRRIRESELRNRQIFDSATDYAIVATDLDGRVTRWNEGARRVLGWTEAEMLGEPAERFFTPEDRAGKRPQVEMRCALETGSGNDERWHLRKGGERFFAAGEMTPLRDAEGSAVGFVKVLRDRTDQRLAEETLATSRADLDTALVELRRLNESLETQVAARTAERNRLWEVSNLLMAVAAFDSTIKEVNPAWRALLGWSAGELVGRSYAEFIHPDDAERSLRWAARLAAGEVVEELDNRYRCKDGGYRSIAWNIERGDGVFHCVGRDVTTEKAQASALAQAEEQLRQSQKLEAVGQLTGGVAHDFNNLLTIIRSSTDFLKREDLSAARRSRYVDAISDTVERASKLTNQLLAFARRQPLKPQVFEVGARVRDVTDLIRPLMGARIAIVVEPCGEPCHTEADVSQFETALVNLAVNARDAMEGEGRLTFTLHEADSIPAIRGHAGAKGDFIAVSVADTGQGIAADQHASIFEPFYTTKAVGKGTGLGLSQVFGFTKQSGGEVAVTSEPGRGAVFTLYLPRVQAAAVQEPGGPGQAGAKPPDGICVLVVEDNEAVGRFADEMLRDLGYDTRLVGGAGDALAALEPEDAGFDVVFSDVIMPGMNGVELAREIRKRRPELPVVLTSGYSNVLAQEGSDGFELLRKPYSIQELSVVLRAVVEAVKPKPGHAG